MIDKLKTLIKTHTFKLAFFAILGSLLIVAIFLAIIFSSSNSKSDSKSTSALTTSSTTENSTTNSTTEDSSTNSTTEDSSTTDSTTTESTTENSATTTEPTSPPSLSHGGVLISDIAFEEILSAIDNDISPNKETLSALLSSPLSNANWNPRAVETAIRGGDGDNIARLYIDVARAYQCALIWRITGSREHGEAACRILNAWSKTLKTVTGNADRYLASGLFGYQLANISEIMISHPLFEVEQMQTMLYEVFYKPLNERFLVGNEFGNPHNDAYFQNYWANWDLCNMASAVAIGIFCEKEDAYQTGIDYFKYGIGNGSIYNAIPYVYEDGIAQWQESGRDQGHTTLGLGLLACVCEMAWNQGDDLYSYADYRLLKAAEYIARYNNGEDVLFNTYEWGSGRNGALNYHTAVSAAGRGATRPIYSMIYNHYVHRLGLSAPNIEKTLTAANNLEYGAVSGGHATTFDQPGWGSLIYTGIKGNLTTLTSKDTPLIEEETYKIISIHTQKSLAIIDGTVVQRDKSANNANLWTLTYLGGGEYKITNKSTGQVLQVDACSYENGAEILAGTYTGAMNQRFSFLYNSSNNYRIVASHSGKAIDIHNWSDSDDARIQQWRYCLGNNQNWYLEKQ